MKKNVGGVTQQIRRLTVSVYERAVETAIGRGLFRAQRYKDHGPYSAPYLPACSMTARLSGSTSGYLRSDQLGQGEAIIAAVNALIWRQR